jgi:homocysteine S-methyltransferase
MKFERALSTEDLILTGGSMYERLRRHDDLAWDTHIAHASLIYDTAGKEIIAGVHREYIAVARAHNLPMMVGAATWRANRERLERSPFADRPVNQDNVDFVRDLCAAEASQDTPQLFEAGGIGPRGNAYSTEEVLDADAAERFHSFQANALAEAEPDVVLAMTLPALEEARGIARALEATGLPYMVSFVVRDTGVILDGTPLEEAIDRIDQERSRPPLGYYINCVHPSVLLRGLSNASEQVKRRLMGFRGNTADKTPEELDDSTELITEDPIVFAQKVEEVRRTLGLKLVGGCCGTGTEHIEQLARTCGERK